MKNVVKINPYYILLELDEEISIFVVYYNNDHYHVSLDNLPPAAVFFGWAKNRLDDVKKSNKKP